MARRKTGDEKHCQQRGHKNSGGNSQILRHANLQSLQIRLDIYDTSRFVLKHNLPDQYNLAPIELVGLLPPRENGRHRRDLAALTSLIRCEGPSIKRVYACG